jgi:DNA modification methylase
VRLKGEVLAGSAGWSCEPSEAMAFLWSLPDGCCSLTLFSPPYEDARTYGIGFKLRGQAWVDWLRPIVVECCRVTSGLVAVNMAGKVRKHRYSGVVELLVADLLRGDGLVCGPSPYTWVRPGIAGSGNRYSGYHRRDWEPVYCFARPERLPLKWHNQTAFGHPPKYGPGGEMSYRQTDGTRVNQWGRHPGGGKSRKANGDKQTGDRPSHGFTITRPREGMHAQTQPYKPPAVANPGNVIRTNSGGNQMGHPLAHENEAPMNLAVAERFVCWYAPPDSIVLDPFAGSGTTAHAAVMHGRRFIGCDLRESQCELVARRMATVQPKLPTNKEETSASKDRGA